MWWFAWTAVRVRPSPRNKNSRFHRTGYLFRGGYCHPLHPLKGDLRRPRGHRLPAATWEATVGPKIWQKMDCRCILLMILRVFSHRRSKNMAFLGLTLRQGCRIRLWRFRKWRLRQWRSKEWRSKEWRSLKLPKEEPPIHQYHPSISSKVKGGWIEIAELPFYRQIVSSAPHFASKPRKFSTRAPVFATFREHWYTHGISVNNNGKRRWPLPVVVYPTPLPSSVLCIRVRGWRILRFEGL